MAGNDLLMRKRGKPPSHRTKWGGGASPRGIYRNACMVNLTSSRVQYAKANEVHPIPGLCVSE